MALSKCRPAHLFSFYLVFFHFVFFLRGGHAKRQREERGKAQEGEVLSIGPGRVDDNGNRVPLDVKVGDKVIYSKYGGTEVKYSGEEYLILSARDVLAVIA